MLPRFKFEKDAVVRNEEAFVGRALVNFLGGSDAVSMADGADPPDLILAMRDATVGVEVTRLMQMTLEPDGQLGNRMTQDISCVQLVDKLSADGGLPIPDGISVLLTLQMPAANTARFRTQLIGWIKEIAPAAKPGREEVRIIEGAKVKASIIPRQPSGKRVVGIVANTRSSPDIALNARLMLETRVREKNRICEKLAGPVWLALLNDYELADADTYAAVCGQLRLEHCFERIFLVSWTGAVSELKIAA